VILALRVLKMYNLLVKIVPKRIKKTVKMNYGINTILSVFGESYQNTTVLPSFEYFLVGSIITFLNVYMLQVSAVVDCCVGDLSH